MFKFFKEMLDSVKEGIAEGKAEFAEEEAAREAARQAVRQEGNAALEARLAASSRYENFAVALAAVYRQTFGSDLKEAREAQRSAVHLLCVDISPNEVESWKKLLARDFSVTNAGEAEAVVTEIVDGLPSQPSDDDLALWIGRAAHLSTGAAAVGYISAGTALDWLEPAVALAVEHFDGWPSFAQSFLAGERNAPGSNVLGRKFLGSVSEKLLEDELSPWKVVAWPPRDALEELLASRAAASRAA